MRQEFPGALEALRIARHLRAEGMLREEFLDSLREARLQNCHWLCEVNSNSSGTGSQRTMTFTSRFTDCLISNAMFRAKKGEVRIG
jgi:hypothetical protein